MELTLPSPAELEAYREGITDEEALQRAADLFTIATGIDEQEDLTSPMERRLVRFAILEMAWAITTRHEDQEAEFSPFSSERIGSYSYSKMLRAVNAGDGTGVSAFDSAVAYFLRQSVYGASSADSEWVFEKGTLDNERVFNHDPAYYGWRSW